MVHNMISPLKNDVIIIIIMYLGIWNSKCEKITWNDEVTQHGIYAEKLWILSLVVHDSVDTKQIFLGSSTKIKLYRQNKLGGFFLIKRRILAKKKIHRESLLMMSTEKSLMENFCSASLFAMVSPGPR